MPIKPIKEVYTDVGGNVTVEYSDDSTMKFNQADTVTAVTNPSPGGISLMVSGNSIPLTFRKRTCVIFGDSITAQNFAVSATYNSYADNGYFNWAQAYLGQPFELVRNAGVGGNGTAAMLARIQVDVLAYSAGWVFVQEVYNDIIGGVPWATTVANLQTIYQTLVNAGSNVIALSGIPSANFTTQAHKDAISNINIWMRAYCLRNPGMVFVDVYTPLLDPTSAAGAGITAYFVDGIHPSTLGAQIMGQAIYNTVKNLIPASGMSLSMADRASATNPYGNVLLNPVMQGSGGSAGAGFSGVIAASWVTLIENGTVSVVCSTPARADFPNFNWQQMAITCSSGVGVVDLYQQPTLPAGIAAGDLIYGQGELNITALATTTLSRLKISITALDSGFTPVANVINNVIAMGNNNGSIIPGSYTLRTPNFVVPADAAYLNFTAQATLAGAGTATFQIGRCEVRKVYG